MIKFSDLSKPERDEKTRNIEKSFCEYNMIIEEASGQLLMWDKNEANSAKKFIQTSNADMKKLEYQFQEMRKRCQQREELLGDANNADNPHELLTRNANELNRGDDLISDLSQGVSQAKDSGLVIIDELNKQGRKIRDIDEHLQRLDTNIETGESIITEMLCRDQRRKFFLWGIIALLVVCIGVFLYFLIS